MTTVERRTEMLFAGLMWLAGLGLGATLNQSLTEHRARQPHWQVTCQESHTVVAQHFDATRHLVLPRYTTICDRWADVWVGEPGPLPLPVPPKDPDAIVVGGTR